MLSSAERAESAIFDDPGEGPALGEDAGDSRVGSEAYVVPRTTLTPAAAVGTSRAPRKRAATALASASLPAPYSTVVAVWPWVRARSPYR
ncbi:hypothetical protein SRIMM317S_02763 [Streptomyces rimosus subsp. rimosus]